MVVVVGPWSRMSVSFVAAHENAASSSVTFSAGILPSAASMPLALGVDHASRAPTVIGADCLSRCRVAGAAPDYGATAVVVVTPSTVAGAEVTADFAAIAAIITSISAAHIGRPNR